MSAPALVICVELEGLPRAYVVAETPDEEIRLRSWLASDPAGLAELLATVGDDPDALFPWLDEVA